MFSTWLITQPLPGLVVASFNRPKRANALSSKSYLEWLQLINWAKTAEEVRVLMLTGIGSYYSSGQELELPSGEGPGLKERLQVTQDLTDALIDFPKPLIAAVNGPAVGYAVTTLALCDMVFCTPMATFTTPFMKLGFCAEACSSYLFPRIMGKSRAQEFLLLNRKFSAEEAVECGLVSRIFPFEEFQSRVIQHIQPLLEYPPNAVKDTKNLLIRESAHKLKEINHREMTLLHERMTSEECAEAVLKFFTNKKAKL